MVHAFQHRGGVVWGVVLPDIFLTTEVEAREYCFFKEAATTIFIEDEALPNKPLIRSNIHGSI
jgi:hypothetical protein